MGFGKLSHVPSLRQRGAAIGAGDGGKAPNTQGGNREDTNTGMGHGAGGGARDQPRCSWDPPSISNSRTHTQPTSSCYNLNTLSFSPAEVRVTGAQLDCKSLKGRDCICLEGHHLPSACHGPVFCVCLLHAHVNE